MQIFLLFGIESINDQMQTTTIIAAQQKRHEQKKTKWQQVFVSIHYNFISTLLRVANNFVLKKTLKH